MNKREVINTAYNSVRPEPRKIRSRLKTIGMSQKDLIYELSLKGVSTTPSQLSDIISGLYTSNKADLVLDTAEEVISKYEYKRHDHTNRISS